MNNKRFIVSYSQGGGLSGKTQVLIDRETGVNYLYINTGYSGGLTVLLDSDGKPYITHWDTPDNQQ